MSSTALTGVPVRRTFYEKIILSLLSKMSKGWLHITMPSGEAITLGNGEGGVNASITIEHTDFFKRCVLYGDVGFGEAYEAGDWNTDNITNVLKWFLLNIEDAPSVSGSNARSLLVNGMRMWNRLLHTRRGNSISGSKKNIAEHYDLNNDFFALFLDKTMTYSSAYFDKKDLSLEEAQYAKYDRLCRQLHLQPSDHVLEIGSGWGGNAIYMATHYGCRVTTITISEEQHRYAVAKVKEAGLENKVEVLLKDYRQMKGRFDKIVSVEMIEAVGAEYLEEYCETCYSLLKRDGILAIQAITCPDSRFEQLRNGVDWIQKHIFPGSLLPSISAINIAMNRTGDLTLVDVKDLGLDYATTLAMWRDSFNNRLQEVKQLGFNNTFIRKWNYYFSYCEAAFCMRNINVMQLVYVRPNTLSR